MQSTPLPPPVAAPSLGVALQRIATLLRLDLADLARGGVRVVFIWALAWVAMRLVRQVARRIELAVDDGDPSTETDEEKRGKTIAQLLRSVGRVVVVVIAILLTLDTFVNIGPLLAGAGILGLAVSFGAQSLVKDVLSGFFMIVENQLHVGDTVEVAGRTGVVERLTLRVVVLRDAEGTAHFIPNSEIRLVSNKTHGWSRVVLDVGVPYEADLDRAVAVLRDEGERLHVDPAWAPRLDGAPEVLGVQALGDSAVQLRMQVRTQPGVQWEVGRELRRRLKLRLEREGMAIPLPQREVRVTIAQGGMDARVAGAAAGA